jgi:intracellular sulfur oxidation DsrE/DsrF family protein
MILNPKMAMLRLLAMLAVLFLGTQLALAAPAHKVAIHVNQQDPAVMNMALNNAQNISAFYASKGEEVTIEIVTYGPGLHMLRADTSPVADRISTMALEMTNLSFSACENTLNGMKKKSQKDVPLLSEATVVPSGAVRLMELQAEGYAYLRP